MCTPASSTLVNKTVPPLHKSSRAYNCMDSCSQPSAIRHKRRERLTEGPAACVLARAACEPAGFQCALSGSLPEALLRCAGREVSGSSPRQPGNLSSSSMNRAPRPAAGMLSSNKSAKPQANLRCLSACQEQCPHTGTLDALVRQAF